MDDEWEEMFRGVQMDPPKWIPPSLPSKKVSKTLIGNDWCKGKVGEEENGGEVLVPTSSMGMVEVKE